MTVVLVEELTVVLDEELTVEGAWSSSSEEVMSSLSLSLYSLSLSEVALILSDDL